MCELIKLAAGQDLDVVELFAGAQSVSNACRFRGLRVASVDVMYGASHDLSTPAGLGLGALLLQHSREQTHVRTACSYRC